MNRRGFGSLVIILLIVGLVVVGVSWYLFESSSHSTSLSQLPVTTSSQAQPSSSIVDRVGAAEANTYVNQQFGYSFTIPRGYQLATDVMLFLNSTSGYPIVNWSATNTQKVVITQSSPTDQQEFLKVVEKGTADIGLNPVADLPESIYVAAVAPTVSELEATLTRLRSLYPNLASSTSAIRHVVISNSNAIRYTTLNTTNGDSQEVTYISFPGQSYLPSGLPVGSILLMSDNEIDNDVGRALDEVIATFKFN